ncbi:MAG: rod shape-determining protein MreC [Candidatus Nomurabacteria bacterium]|nr:rod shape-determining protein MreC [Candidatus Nomurabacteria bacterium]
MSYLLDKKIKQKKVLKIALGVVVLLILLYFRSGIFNGFSIVGHVVFRPVLILGNSVGEKIKSAGSYFAFKNSLSSENENLKSELEKDKATMANYDSVLAENVSLKEIFGRTNLGAELPRGSSAPKFVLSAILAKPNQSPYDTLVIDAGASLGIKKGDTVFALGNVPIGRVDLVYPNSSKVILFSNSGEKTQVVIGSKPARNASGIADAGGNIFTEIVGRGGGNFEMVMPKDLTLAKGDQAVLPGIVPYVLGIVETTISDPRDPFQKALLVSPVNIQELKFVEVEK